MVGLLTTTTLGREIAAVVMAPTRRDRCERIAWILPDGRLGPPGAPGTTQQVPVPQMPSGAIGLVHSHPSMPTSIVPPSHERGDEDYDEDTFQTTPIQFVVESDSGRLWGQFPGGYTILMARLLGAWVQVVADGDALATIAFKTVSMDVVQEMRAHEARLRAQEQRDALQRKASHPGNP
jgi:hypothetical protein